MFVMIAYDKPDPENVLAGISSPSHASKSKVFRLAHPRNAADWLFAFLKLLNLPSSTSSSAVHPLNVSVGKEYRIFPPTASACTFPSNVTFFRFMQSINTPAYIAAAVPANRMVISSRLLHPLNASFPREEIPAAPNSFRLEPLNALSPILFTFSGNSISVRFLFSKNFSGMPFAK